MVNLMNRDRKSTLIKAAGIAALLLIIYWMVHPGKTGLQALPTPVVIVENPVLKPLAEYITQTGNTVAFNSVDLVARVEGYLDEILFTDGSFVKKQAPLFVIEPQPYMEKLKEAQASVAAQKADFDYSKSEYARQQRMYKENATSLNNVEKWFAKMHASEAEVAKALANEAIAKINYGYTHITAPFDGRIGRHLVDTNNLVGNGKATVLANIEQIDPIYVYFNLNELDLIRVRAAARAAGLKPEDLDKISVYVQMQNEKDFPHEGKLNFVNTGLNASTGTMEFRALLPNKNYALLPGLFVQVRLAISKEKPTFTVPDNALMYDQRGAYLLLVDNHNRVITRPVETGASEGGRRAILKGLKAEDRVIIDGLQYATPGNAVDPRMQSARETTP